MDHSGRPTCIGLQTKSYIPCCAYICAKGWQMDELNCNDMQDNRRSSGSWSIPLLTFPERPGTNSESVGCLWCYMHTGLVSGLFRCVFYMENLFFTLHNHQETVILLPIGLTTYLCKSKTKEKEEKGIIRNYIQTVLMRLISLPPCLPPFLPFSLKGKTVDSQEVCVIMSHTWTTVQPLLSLS